MGFINAEFDFAIIFLLLIIKFSTLLAPLSGAQRLIYYNAFRKTSNLFFKSAVEPTYLLLSF